MDASDLDDLAVALGEISRQLRDRGEPAARALADAFDRVAVRAFEVANDAWRTEHGERSQSPPTFPRNPAGARVADEIALLS